MKRQSPRDPYLIKARYVYPGKTLKDSDATLYGPDPEKGIDVLVASEHGAIDIRLWRQGGATMARVRLLPWKDFTGSKRGQTQELYAGPIDGNWPDPSVITPPKGG